MAGYSAEYHSSTYGAGWEEMVAPSINRARPRALVCAYHRRASALVISFRPPTRTNKQGRAVKSGESTWIVYLDTPLEMWEQLRDEVVSTGKWLRESGIENGTYYEVDKNKLNEIVRDIASADAK
jgi:hypothetical protein